MTQTVTPYLLYEDVEGATAFLQRPPAGFQNPAAVGRTSIVYVIVTAVDAHHDRAKSEGATITEELVDLPFGHRRYSCRDPLGHGWAFAQVVEGAT
jgi:uncharacterized glyoxalase superfamily protein PhnB